MHLLLSNQKATGKVHMRVVDLLSREEPAGIVYEETSEIVGMGCLLQLRHAYLKTQNCPVEAAGEQVCGIKTL